MEYTFRHPEPNRAASSVWPVFLPYKGCPNRCIFCAQHLQTGQRIHEPLDITLAGLEAALRRRQAEGGAPLELAFYGGTFTALPAPWPQRFLTLAKIFKDSGLVTRVRCSTRPDAVSEPILAQCRELGLDMLELGIQSFDDDALALCERGYDGRVAEKACHMVKGSGLALGIQLMPGLPGDYEGMFLEDVLISAAIAPEAVRLYPCVVMDGTHLADLYREGHYVPWSLERTKEELAAAMLIFWKHNVRVIRTGLSPEPSMQRAILAGPWHEALGQSVRGIALQKHITQTIDSLGAHADKLYVPTRYCGEILGHKKELAPLYCRMGLGPGHIQIWDEEHFQIDSAAL